MQHQDYHMQFMQTQIGSRHSYFWKIKILGYILQQATRNSVVTCDSFDPYPAFMHPDSLLRLRCHINHLLTYLLTLQQWAGTVNVGEHSSIDHADSDTFADIIQLTDLIKCKTLLQLTALLLFRARIKQPLHCTAIVLQRTLQSANPRNPAVGDIGTLVMVPSQTFHVHFSLQLASISI